MEIAASIYTFVREISNEEHSCNVPVQCTADESALSHLANHPAASHLETIDPGDRYGCSRAQLSSTHL